MAQQTKGGGALRCPEVDVRDVGVAPTATEEEIKRAYRGLALKFHPDVNKQPGAQEKFLEIKNAYQTLVDCKSRSKYDAGSRTRADDWDVPFQWDASSSGRKSTQPKEEFYGFGEFFKDLESDLQKRSSSRSAKPKSLWEELADIGEEFVEFLEKELPVRDGEGDTDKPSATSASSRASSASQAKRVQSSKSKPTNGGGTMAPACQVEKGNGTVVGSKLMISSFMYYILFATKDFNQPGV